MWPGHLKRIGMASQARCHGASDPPTQCTRPPVPLCPHSVHTLPGALGLRPSAPHPSPSLVLLYRTLPYPTPTHAQTLSPEALADSAMANSCTCDDGGMMGLGDDGGMMGLGIGLESEC